MTSLQAMILGIIQGLTEFLPVSSSGHLIFLPFLFGWKEHIIAFDAVLHLGTLSAVIWYFRRELSSVWRYIFLFDKSNTEAIIMTRLLAIGTIPALMIGGVLSFFDIDPPRSPAVIAASLIVWGVILGFADWRHKKKQKIPEIQPPDVSSFFREITAWQAFCIGCFQAVAFIPGTSRSGITMTAALFLGFSRGKAAHFSFLLSIPIIAIAGIEESLSLITDGVGNGQLLSLVIGYGAAAMSGWFAIATLMKVIARWSFLPFVLYRVVVGIVILFIV